MKLPFRSPWPPKPISLTPRGPARTRVLLSYLRGPFEQEPDSAAARSHTNWFECRAMAEAFLNEGCKVDVVERNDPRVVPTREYGVVIDIHNNLERWAPLLGPNCRKVLHATGAHWLTQNKAELSRLLALRERRGISLRPRRQSIPVAAIEAADCATILGNAFTMESFAFAAKPLHRIPISSAYTFDWIEGKNWADAAKRFLWMGSFGMVHKGLDLVLEAFAKSPDCHLTICGRPEKEQDFFQHYKKELTGLPNIQCAGWMEPSSPEFLNILRTHGSMIYPSCSEGGGGALIHAMHGGLLPVATRAASVDLQDFGVPIGRGTVDGVRQSMQDVLDLGPNELEQRCRASWNHVLHHHTRETFQKNYRHFAGQLLLSL